MPDSLKYQLKFFNLFIQKKNFWIIVATDIALIIAAHACSYMIRFPGGFETSGFKYPLIATLPLLIAVKIPIFYAFGLYRGMWRYTSLNDLFNIVKATAIAFLISSCPGSEHMYI